MARPGDQRHLPRPARVYRPSGHLAPAQAPAQPALLSLPANHSPQRPRPLEPGSLISGSSPTEWSHAFANQLLNRYGVLTRESVASENLPGGFSAIYDVLKALEESGRIRRGYFVAGLGATQFALPAAVDLLRSLRNGPPLEKPEMVTLAATDPANLYGSVLRWPAGDERQPRMLRVRSPAASAPAWCCATANWWRTCAATTPTCKSSCPATSRSAQTTARDLSLFLAALAQQEMERREDQRGGMLISTMNGQPAAQHFLPPSCRTPAFILPRRASISGGVLPSSALRPETAASQSAIGDA